MSICTISYKKQKADLFAQAEQHNDFFLHSPNKIHVNVIIKPDYTVQTLGFWEGGKI